MASTSRTDAPSPGTLPIPPPLPPPPKSANHARKATCQTQFEQGVAYALHLWPDLTLAVQNNWGGPDSSDKRDWFAGAVVDLFPELPTTAKPPTTTTTSTTSAANGGGGGEQTDDCEPDSAYVEEFLLQVMLDEFEVNVDDDSSYEVAETIVRVRGECARGKFDEVEALRRRWEGKKGGKVVFKKAEDQDAETDWDTDSDEEEEGDEDEDVEMGDVSPPAAPREKPQPEVDEDGFTKVTKKKR